MTDRLGVIFEEYDIELWRLNGQCVAYGEDGIGQGRNRSYIYALH